MQNLYQFRREVLYLLLNMLLQTIFLNNPLTVLKQTEAYGGFVVGLICCHNVALFVVSSSYFLWHVTEIGLGLIGFGVMFTLLGVFLFFERSFVAIGNVRFSLLTIWPLFCCSSSNALCLCPLICLYFVSSLMELFVRSDPPSVWGDLNHWSDVYLTNFHKTTKF